MALYALLADLPLAVEGYSLEQLARQVSSSFARVTTVVRLRGAGEEGLGEDVTYGEPEQRLFHATGPVHDLAGRHTLDSFSRLVGSLDLFPQAPSEPAWRLYRRWAFESAALDLALRQAGRSLAGALGRSPAPVGYVVSRRLPEPPALADLEGLVALYPGIRFKVDPTSSWSEEVVAGLAALGRVEIADLKGAYRGTSVDQPADLRLYRLVAEGLPGVLIEDPDLRRPEIDRLLEPHRDRITWDAVIHSAAEIEALPFPPPRLNFKASRFGSVRELLEAYEYCAERGIGVYGGGQFELGVGRGQIQYLASLFHPDAPNDVAPAGFNDPGLPPGLPASPLELAPEPVGFRLLASQPLPA